MQAAVDDENGLEGGCCCGAARYRVLALPLIVHCCHCSWCQRETGSAFAVNALIEADRVQLLSGEVQVSTLPTFSGSGQEITRCAVCNTALWSRYALAGIGDRVRFVRVGTLDCPDRMPPDVHIFTDSAQPWLVMEGDAPQFGAYYRTREVWSEGSLARRRLLLEAEESPGAAVE